MKIKRKILLIMIIIIILINTITCIRSHAVTPTISPQSNTTSIDTQSDNLAIKIDDIQETINLYSEAAVLIDSKTGTILYGKNENQIMYPASTTKILTAIIALEKCDLSDKITASYNAVMSIPAGYSNAAIQPDEILTLQELLDMFLIHSANEVGLILAEHISGSIEEFANLMNQKAVEIGCTNTHFTNPSGIHDENHYSTAYDMALIAKYCMQNEEFRNVVAKKSCTIAPTNKYEERYFVNTNDLILPSSQYYYQYAIGIKTGFTTQAKNCLISASLKDNLELITVVLGAQTTETGKSGRYIDTINLFEYGYSKYKIQEIATQNSVIDEITIPNATKETKNLQLLLKDSISSITPANFDLDNLDYNIELNENISAPIAEGSVLGKITYNIDGINYSSDLLASHNVEKSNLAILICQIVMVIIVLLILTKLLSPKKSSKKKKLKKSKKKNDAIYKF